VANICRIVVLAAGLSVFGSAVGVAADGSPAPPVGRWTALFNGKDLTGWTPKIKGYAVGENHGETFRVRDGLLEVVYDPKAYPEFGARYGHLFYALPFSSYRLRVEYRFVGEQCKGGAGWALRNSGVMIHGQTPASMGKDQDFPVSIEVQLLGGPERGVRSTANLCTPGTNVVMGGKLITTHCTNSTSPTLRGDQWVTVEIECHGNGTIRHRVNGQVVIEYEQPQLDPTDPDARKLLNAGQDEMLSGGTISLQSESHPVQFRKVEIMPLEK